MQGIHLKESLPITGKIPFYRIARAKAASEALAECSLLVSGEGESLLPSIANIRDVSKKIARACALQAMAAGPAITIPETALAEKINKPVWEPEYRSYKRTSF
ncbi:MAG: hypothetical protein ACRERS_03025 [Methylococcales bacterium]